MPSLLGNILLFSAVLVSSVFAGGPSDNPTCRKNDGKCYNGPRNINGRSCQVTCGVDHPGGDYANAHVDSFDACVKLCAADKYCVTAQFHEDISWCYLKNQLTAAVVGAGHDTVECAGAAPYVTSTTTTTTTTPTTTTKPPSTTPTITTTKPPSTTEPPSTTVPPSTTP